jgi:trigger factor
MSVVIAEQDVGPWRKQLTIEVPAPAVDAETQRVVADYSRQARLPGFRKGKVPLSLVQRRFAEEIRKEVLDRLVPRYWKQAQAEKKLEPMLPPSVGDVSPPLAGAPLTFTATVEVRPEVRSLELEGLELPAMDTGVGPEDIEQALDGIRRDRSTWKQVERAAGQGDLVHAQVTEVSADGEALGEPQRGHFEIGDPQVWEEVSVALLGSLPGHKGGFVHQAPAHDHDHDHAHGEHDHHHEPAPDRHFKFTVERVDERDLPPLDDALAQAVGVADLGTLRADIASRIGDAKRGELRRRRHQAVLDQLRERHPLELPQGVVRHETENLLREYAEDLARQGVDIEKAELDWQKIGEQAKPQAERRVHSRILLDAVAEARGIQTSEEELERAIVTIARAQGKPTLQIRQTLDEQGRLSVLRTQLRRDKVLAALTGESTPGGEAP